MVPRNPHRGRAIAGGVLYTLLMAAGATILLVLFVIRAPIGEERRGTPRRHETRGDLAFPPLLVYLWVPWIINRFDPEPWWCLALALAWGGVAAAGFSGLINTEVVVAAQAMAGGGKKGIAFGEVVGACVSAPLVEEFWKGLAVFGIFFFLRREFDGVVDGIIYGTFAALGFAATENVMYYARAGSARCSAINKARSRRLSSSAACSHPGAPALHLDDRDRLRHLARDREGVAKVARSLARLYVRGLLARAVERAATISGMLMMLMLPLWILFVLAFFGIIVWLVVRKGRIIRENLTDEVLIGALSQDELDLICSPIGRMRASFGYGGRVGRRFVASGARLGLCKWHAARAIKSKKANHQHWFHRAAAPRAGAPALRDARAPGAGADDAPRAAARNIMGRRRGATPGSPPRYPPPGGGHRR